MKKILLSMILILGLVGCGSSSSAPQEEVVGPEPYVIFDNDFGFSDPDNDGALTMALAMHKAGLIKLLAISRVGTDLQNNGTIIASAQLEYWGYPEIEIGINPNASMMRHVTTKGSTSYPSQHPIYSGDYQDIRQFPFDGCLTNDAGCGTRINMIELYRKTLEASPKKVNIASGGQVINIAEALRAHPELFAEKVNKIIFLGRNSRTTLSGQDFGGNEYAIWAMKYLVNNLPDSIQLIEASTDVAYEASYQEIPNSRIGTIFQEYHINSPVGFVYGLYHPYGVGLIEGFSIIDGIPLIAAAFGNTLPNGQVIGALEGVSFHDASKFPTISKSPNGKHFLFQANRAQWSLMKEYLEDVIISQRIDK